MPLFQPRTLEDHTDSIANYLPGGDVFQAKFLEGKKLRKYLRSVATELARYHTVLEETATEHHINETQNLINEWESAMGIPGTCFNNTGTLEQRRRNVLLKLTGLHGSTAEDFINLAKTLGYTILVEPARYHGMFPAAFPVYFYDAGKTVQFTIIITLPPDENIDSFPLEFPFKFMKPSNSLLQCIFNRMRPANVNIHYRFDELISSIGRPPAEGDSVTNTFLLEDGTRLLLEDADISYLVLE